MEHTLKGDPEVLSLETPILVLEEASQTYESLDHTLPDPTRHSPKRLRRSLSLSRAALELSNSSTKHRMWSPEGFERVPLNLNSLDLPGVVEDPWLRRSTSPLTDEQRDAKSSCATLRKKG